MAPKLTPVRTDGVAHPGLQSSRTCLPHIPEFSTAKIKISGVSRKMPSYADDCAYGNSNQSSVRTLLNEVYGIDHVEQSRYETFDFISADGQRYVEVKSRRCPIGRCPNSLLGANKVDAARRIHPTKDVLFVWVYEDDIYCLDYDPVLFDTFTRAPFRRADRPGIRDFDADTIFVPSHLLRPLRTPAVHDPTNTLSPSTAPPPNLLMVSS